MWCVSHYQLSWPLVLRDAWQLWHGSLWVAFPEVMCLSIEPGGKGWLWGQPILAVVCFRGTWRTFLHFHFPIPNPMNPTKPDLFIDWFSWSRIEIDQKPKVRDPIWRRFLAEVEIETKWNLSRKNPNHNCLNKFKQKQKMSHFQHEECRCIMSCPALARTFSFSDRHVGHTPDCLQRGWIRSTIRAPQTKQPLLSKGLCTSAPWLGKEMMSMIMMIHVILLNLTELRIAELLVCFCICRRSSKISNNLTK